MDELGAAERERLDRYERVLQNIRDAVYTLDADGRITWVNLPAVEEFDVGYDREELIGAPVSKVLDDEDIEKAVSIIRTLLTDPDRDSGRCEIAIQTAHGTEIPCELRLALLRTNDGEFRGTVGVLRDVTDRKRREQRLSVFNRVLRHNLRNDLSLVLGPAEELEERLDGEDAAAARRIRERAEHLHGLAEKARRIEDALQDEDGTPARIDVSELVRDRVTTFRQRYPSASIAVDAPDEQVVRADPDLRVAIDELLENAIEHNDEPRRVAVSVPAEPTDGWVAIRIEDDGPGIPDAETAVLDDDLETPLEHGSGLGLWSVRWLVDRADGRLSFAENEPRGTVVTVELPAAEADRG